MFASLKEANHLRAFLFSGLVILASFLVVPYITIHLIGNVGVAQDDIPLVYLFGGIATLFSSRWIGLMADRHGKVRVYRWVAVGSLLPLLWLTHLGPMPLIWVLACTTVFFMLVPGRMVPAMAIVTSAARPELRGTVLALNAAMLQLASGVAAAVSGIIIAIDAHGQLLNYAWVGYLSAVITLCGLWWVGRVRIA